MAAAGRDESTMVKEAMALFEKKFGRKPTHGSSAPGRVNIIGEHTDYSDGFVFPMALPLVTVMVGAPSRDRTCRILTDADGADEPKYFEFPCPTKEAPLKPGKPNWVNYVKGVIDCFPDKYPIIPFEAAIVSSVPLGSGLSSSASLEVATFTLLEALLGAKDVSPEDKAKACQRAEHTFAGVPCGIMDQFIATMGKDGHALLIDCRSLNGKLFPLKDPSVVMLITNSNVRHALGSSQYPVRRQQCEAAAKTMGVSKLRDATMKTLDGAQSKLDKVVYQRAHHVISENKRCEDAGVALEKGDYTKLGALMSASHKSLKEDFEVSCKELDELVTLASQTEGVFGSRMTGGGFGGCTVTLVKATQVQKCMDNIKGKYSGKATFFVCKAANGAHCVTLPS